MSDYQEKIERKRERMRNAADKALQKADAADRKLDTIAACIPLGQPILVGHHSEKRHRRDIKRMDQNMRTSVEERKRAVELERRAEGLGEHGISSDDPEAIGKLKEKLGALEKEREAYKAHNKKVRLVKATEDAKIPGWKLTNLGANIRTVKARIASLEAAQAKPETAPIVGVGFRAEESREDNRLRIYFDAKPAENVRAFLKSRGFRWSPTEGAWQRQISNAATYAVTELQKLLDAVTYENGLKELEGRSDRFHADPSNPSSCERYREHYNRPCPCEGGRTE